MGAQGEVVAVERDRRRAGGLAAHRRADARAATSGSRSPTRPSRAARRRSTACWSTPLLGPRDAAGPSRPALANDARIRSRQLARGQAAILAAGAARPPSGWRAGLLYLHDLSAIENERRIAAFLDSTARFEPSDAGAADAAPPRPHGGLLHRAAAAAAERVMDGEPGGAATGAGRSRAAVPPLRRAVAAPDQPARALPLRVLPAPLRAHLGVPQLRRALDDRADGLDGDVEVQQLRRHDAAGRMSASAHEPRDSCRASVAPSILSADFGRLREQVQRGAGRRRAADPRRRHGRPLRARRSRSGPLVVEALAEQRRARRAGCSRCT